MGDRWLLDLHAVLARAGVPVVEVDGWQYRARSSGGYGSGAPGHVMVHHTASPPSSDGWPDVEYLTFHDADAPLANLYLDRSGVWYVCAAGATNTNGTGSDPCGHIADDTMNSDAIGVEAGNNGVGEVWPYAQLDSYVLGVAALCAAYGIPVARVHGHAEWAPSRKVDPAGPPRYAIDDDTWNMDAFRGDVDHATDPGGFLMALTDDQQRTLYDRVMGALPDPTGANGRPPAPGPRTWTLDDQDGAYITSLLERIAAKLGA